MNARELHNWLKDDPQGAETYYQLPSHEARSTILRALRLLAAAEANDGTTPETAAAQIILWQNDETGRTSWQKTQPGPNWYRVGTPALCLLEDARRLERERNGLAARVAELEKDAERLDWMIDDYRIIDLYHAIGVSDRKDKAACRAAIDAARGSKP